MSGKLQQSQADLMASRRQAEEVATQLAAAQQQVEALNGIKAELTQVRALSSPSTLLCQSSFVNHAQRQVRGSHQLQS